MDPSLLFQPFDRLDSGLGAALEGAPLLAALAIALALGLRHASDPDHLVAVTSVVAAGGHGPRGAARLGAWWGAGHAATLLTLGVPAIVLKVEVPAWVEAGAARGVGVVIVLLAGRVLVKCLRGDYRPDTRIHPRYHPHRHLRRRAGPRHCRPYPCGEAFGIGVLHGLAGTGAVVLLLMAAVPGRLEAAAALAVFAPASVASMAFCSATGAVLLTRPSLDPMVRAVVIPTFSLLALVFGAGYLVSA